MIMDVIKYHLIPHLSQKKISKEMFDALVGLYQSENINEKMILWNKLRAINMTSLDLVTNYLIKVKQIHNQLAAVGEKVANVELANMALNGFLTSQEPFFKGACAHENLPNSKRLGDNCIQQDTRKDSTTSKNGGGKNLSLIGQAKKGKGQEPIKGKGRSEQSTSQSRKKELSEIKCFICHKHGNCASQFQDKKKEKGKRQQHLQK